MSFTQISVDIDEADAVVLQENLTKTKELISQISSSLNKISHSTLNSSNLLNPIVEKNKNLSTLKRNIDDSIFQVSNIQGIASEASLYESKLAENIDNVRQYITTIHKSDDILEKLNDSNEGIEYKGIQENLSKTLNASIIKLSNYLFQHLFKTISTPFDPQIFINDRKPFPYIEDNKLKDSIAIIRFFQDSEYEKIIPIEKKYVDSRIKLISDSLAFIEPFVKTRIKNDKNIPYEKGSNGIINYTEALIGLIYNEYALLEDLFKDKDEEVRFFKDIFNPVLEKYHSLCSSILKSVQSSTAISSAANTDGLVIFELIDGITKVQQAVTSKSSEQNPQLQQDLESCQITSRSLFENLLKYTETKVMNLTSLPTDNGICEVTVEIMSKLRKFSEFKESLLKVMSNGQVKAGSWIPTSPKPQWLSVFSSVSQTAAVDDENPLELLSSFFSDVIDALIVSLEIKGNSGIIKKKQTLGYFLITNIILVEQIISRSELNNILQGPGLTRLEKLKKRALNYFLTGWKTAAAYLLDVNIVGKMTSKDKDTIKEKFKNFNLEFEELVKSYKQYNITDPNLKKFLSKEIGFISPLYHRFYDKHSASDFTKHQERYLKYSKVEFDRILESLGR